MAGMSVLQLLVTFMGAVVGVVIPFTAALVVAGEEGTPLYRLLEWGIIVIAGTGGMILLIAVLAFLVAGISLPGGRRPGCT